MGVQELPQGVKMEKDTILKHLNNYLKVAETRASFDVDAASSRGMPQNQIDMIKKDRESAKEEVKALNEVISLVNTYK